jgi:hypothetical protein
MRKIVILIALLTVHTLVAAQDIINTTDGRELKVKVVEIEELTVKYYNFNQLDGPLRTINKEFIDFILYQDGTIERFTAIRRPESTIKPGSQQISPEHRSIEYVNLRLEKAKALQSTTNTTMWVGLGLFFSSAVLAFSDINQDNTVYLVGISVGSTTAIVSMLLNVHASSRVTHFTERKKELSLFIAPGSSSGYLAHNDIKQFHIGVKFNF